MTLWKSSGTQIHRWSSFTKPSNFIELHWRSNGVVAESASLEQSSLIQMGQKGFTGDSPVFYTGVPSLLFRVFQTCGWRNTCTLWVNSTPTHLSPPENPGLALWDVWHILSQLLLQLHWIFPKGGFCPIPSSMVRQTLENAGTKDPPPKTHPQHAAGGRRKITHICFTTLGQKAKKTSSPDFRVLVYFIHGLYI